MAFVISAIRCSLSWRSSSAIGTAGAAACRAAASAAAASSTAFTAATPPPRSLSTSSFSWLARALWATACSFNVSFSFLRLLTAPSNCPRSCSIVLFCDLRAPVSSASRLTSAANFNLSSPKESSQPYRLTSNPASPTTTAAFDHFMIRPFLVRCTGPSLAVLGTDKQTLPTLSYP